MEESHVIDMVLEGYTVHHGPQKRRGALDAEKLQAVSETAITEGRPDIAHQGQHAEQVDLRSLVTRPGFVAAAIDHDLIHRFLCARSFCI